MNLSLSTPKMKLHHYWSMYDWANSAYNLVITSTIFPAYYDAITTQKVDGVIVSDQVQFLGWTVSNSALFSYALAFAYLLISFLSPILSSIADSRGNKRYFLSFFLSLGALACMILYFFTGERVEMGIIPLIFATVGYCGSLVFYNAYLPEIAELDERDKLSARGFAYGYIGSVILQIICFVFVMKAAWWGQDEAWGSRFSFFLVGVWWLGFGWYSILHLPKGARPQGKSEHSIIATGFKELKKVAQEVKKMPVLWFFLISFFFYSMGVQTVMLAATIFGSKVLQLEASQLITTILLIQIVAILGAYLMSKLSGIFGNIKVLIAVVMVWILVCVASYFIQTAMHFYIVASVVGLVMGGIQSLSRSTYAKLMPKTQDTASYFSFYDITEKVAIVLGMFSFGFIDQLTGSMRNSIVALVAFFFLGLVSLLFTLRKEKQILEKV